jgi:Putative cyclase
MRVQVSYGSMLVTGVMLAGVAFYEPVNGWQQASRHQDRSPGVTESRSVSDINKAQFDRWMGELSNWGRWGKDDEVGTLNLITPVKRAAALSLARAGISLSMSRPITKQSTGQPRVFQRGFVNRFAFGTEPQYGEYIEELQEIGYHVSPMTHLDALCHVAYNGLSYNGRKFKEIATLDGGCLKNGIASLKDGIVTRGILVDLPNTRVGRPEIEAWERKTGIKVSPGDALFLRAGRTGGTDPNSMMPFYKERGIAILGGGQDSPIEGVPLPLHVFALVGLGLHLIDGPDLEALAATAARLKRWEFMFVLAPLPVYNGAGSAVNPVAVF